jgi:multicomponent K+:H+ antiporter subunit G
MGIIGEFLIAAALVISGIFGFVGSFGLVRLKHSLQRLHAPTKATTLGVGGMLIASMIWFYVEKGQFSFHELLITLFLFLTAPVSAHFIAKVYMVRHLRPEDLPDSGGDYGWSAYDDPPRDQPKP